MHEKCLNSDAVAREQTARWLKCFGERPVRQAQHLKTAGKTFGQTDRIINLRLPVRRSMKCPFRYVAPALIRTNVSQQL